METRHLILALSLCIVPFVGFEPKRSEPIFYGVITEPARSFMMRQWTDSATQVERAYCVTSYRTFKEADPLSPNDTVIVTLVDGVVQAKTEGASERGIETVYCNGEPTVHTHPPLTCVESGCYYGGPNAFSCQPSSVDYKALKQENEYFSIVQCDRKAFVFYYNPEALDKRGFR